jgi:ribosomal protein S27AE
MDVFDELGTDPDYQAWLDDLEFDRDEEFCPECGRHASAVEACWPPSDAVVCSTCGYWSEDGGVECV